MYVAVPPDIATFKTFTIIINSVSALNNRITTLEVKHWTVLLPVGFRMQTQ